MEQRIVGVAGVTLWQGK
jgi:hypothetical protein